MSSYAHSDRGIRSIAQRISLASHSRVWRRSSRLPAGWCKLRTRAKAASTIERSCLLQVGGYDLDGSPGQCGAVGGPGAPGAPVAVVAGLGGEQVEQGVAVAGVVGGDGFGQDPLVEQRTRLLHRGEHPFIAADPGNVAGPAAAFHMEAPVFGFQLPDHLGQPVLPVIQPLFQSRIWGRITGRSAGPMPAEWSPSRYSVTFMAGVWVPELSRITSKYLGGNSFIMTPPFSPSAIWVTSGGTPRPSRSQRDNPLAS